MSRPKIADRRKAELAAIHVAKTQLQMEDDVYRDLVARVSSAHGTEHTSAGDLDPRQRRALLDEMRALGASYKPGATIGRFPGKPANFARLPRYVEKVEALLADMGLSWAYADAICKRQTGIARVGWLKKDDHWIGLIAALDAEQFKRCAGPEIDRVLAERGLTEADLPKGMRKNWRRSVPALKAIATWLDYEWLSEVLRKAAQREASHG